MSSARPGRAPDDARTDEALPTPVVASQKKKRDAAKASSSLFSNRPARPPPPVWKTVANGVRPRLAELTALLGRLLEDPDGAWRVSSPSDLGRRIVEVLQDCGSDLNLCDALAPVHRLVARALTRRLASVTSRRDAVALFEHLAFYAGSSPEGEVSLELMTQILGSPALIVVPLQSRLEATQRLCRSAANAGPRETSFLRYLVALYASAATETKASLACLNNVFQEVLNPASRIAFSSSSPPETRLDALRVLHETCASATDALLLLSWETLLPQVERGSRVTLLSLLTADQKEIRDFVLEYNLVTLFQRGAAWKRWLVRASTGKGREATKPNAAGSGPAARSVRVTNAVCLVLAALNASLFPDASSESASSTAQEPAAVLRLLRWIHAQLHPELERAAELAPSAELLRFLLRRVGAGDEDAMELLVLLSSKSWPSFMRLATEPEFNDYLRAAWSLGAGPTSHAQQTLLLNSLRCGAACPREVWVRTETSFLESQAERSHEDVFRFLAELAPWRRVSQRDWARLAVHPAVWRALEARKSSPVAIDFLLSLGDEDWDTLLSSASSTSSFHVPLISILFDPIDPSRPLDADVVSRLTACERAATRPGFREPAPARAALARLSGLVRAGLHRASIALSALLSFNRLKIEGFDEFELLELLPPAENPLFPIRVAEDPEMLEATAEALLGLVEGQRREGSAKLQETSAALRACAFLLGRRGDVSSFLQARMDEYRLRALKLFSSVAADAACGAKLRWTAFQAGSFVLATDPGTPSEDMWSAVQLVVATCDNFKVLSSALTTGMLLSKPFLHRQRKGAARELIRVATTRMASDPAWAADESEREHRARFEARVAQLEESTCRAEALDEEEV